MRNTFVLYSIILVSLLILSIFWEFYLEDPVLHALQIEHRDETVQESVEYVFTIFVFGVLSLIFPYIMSLKAEARRSALELEREHLIAELKKSVEEITRLNGVIPICSYCSKIRNDEGTWEALEDFIKSHSEVRFSHGACPSCFEIEMKKLDDLV